MSSPKTPQRKQRAGGGGGGLDANISSHLKRMSIKPVGARPLGFDVVAKVRRVQKKEESKRRIYDKQSQARLGTVRHQSERAIPEPSSMMVSPPLFRRAKTETTSYGSNDDTTRNSIESIDENKSYKPELTPLTSRDEGTDDEAGNNNGGGDVEQQPPSLVVEKESTHEILFQMIFCKYVSVLLIFVPFAFISHFMGWSPSVIFWCNFFAMVPLASILGDFTEEVAAHTNQTIGGLVNATFGNAVEVVVGIQALLGNEIRVVQASLIGSIFSNLLLVLGCCFFFGGMIYKEQSFNSTAATANMGLLALSSIALVLPTPFADYYEIQDEHVLVISRFAAVFLILMYIQLLIFQLHTHAEIFDNEDTDDENSDGDTNDNSNNIENDDKDIVEKIDNEDDDDEPIISMTAAIIGLFTVTIIIALLSDYLVDSIDGFVESSGISRTFVGLIILPIVGNFVEHLTAITVAMKDKMDLAMGIAVGSCTQISLFVVPLMVMVGWIADKNMTLNFPHFEIILYVLSVLTVSICLSNPKGNWLEGSLLITTYVMIAVGFWYEKVKDF